MCDMKPKIGSIWRHGHDKYTIRIVDTLDTPPHNMVEAEVVENPEDANVSGTMTFSGVELYKYFIYIAEEGS